jgi:hypothetical protein
VSFTTAALAAVRTALLSAHFPLHTVNEWCPDSCAVWVREQAAQKDGPLSMRKLDFFPRGKFSKYLNQQDRAYQKKLFGRRSRTTGANCSVPAAEKWLGMRKFVKFMCAQPCMPVGMACFKAKYLENDKDPWAAALDCVNKHLKHGESLRKYSDYE